MKQIDPVIKNKTSFSILLLRDDSKVVSFRLTPFWIKFLLFFFAVFSGLSGAVGYTAHYYWKKYNNLQRERSEMAEILGENRRQLGRFAGIEKIKESTLPRSTMVGITAVAPGNGSQAEPAGVSPAVQNGTSPSPAASPVAVPAPQPATQPPGSGQRGSGAAPEEPSAAPPARSAQNGAAPQPEQRIETAAPAQPAPEDHMPGAANGTFTERTMTASGPGGAPALGDGHPALVDEVQIKHAGGNRFRLQFDLSNRNQQMTLNGRVRLAVGTKAGARRDVADVNRDTLRFVINRFKKVTTAFSLPEDMQNTDAAALFVTVSAEDVPEVTYRFSFPEL